MSAPSFTRNDVTIRKQKRKSLALRLTPNGPVALIPHDLDAESNTVQNFIEQALQHLPQPEPLDEPLDPAGVHRLVAAWSQRLDVCVHRTQIRQMRNKWGSISTVGNLTLADALLQLPLELAEYVVVHELLHLKFPDHRTGWQVSMGMYLPDWREQEKRLQAFVLSGN